MDFRFVQNPPAARTSHTVLERGSQASAKYTRAMNVFALGARQRVKTTVDEFRRVAGRHRFQVGVSCRAGGDEMDSGAHLESTI
jgi:hypothetical protein